jgi:DNA-binding response OmpR family regulator
LNGKILIAGNESLMIEGLKFNLSQEGFEIDCAYSREQLIERLNFLEYRLIIFDMEPAICALRYIRQKWSTPIIVLAASEDNGGMEISSVYFIQKPFNMASLRIKIGEVFRIGEVNGDVDTGIIKTGEVVIDTFLRKVTIGTREIKLSIREYEILVLLARNRNKVYSREDIYNDIWGPFCTKNSKVVDIHVRRLRNKMETDPKNPVYIMTSWGRGFYFNA